MKASDAYKLLLLGMLYVEMTFSTGNGGIIVMALTFFIAMRRKLRGD